MKAKIMSFENNGTTSMTAFKKMTNSVLSRNRRRVRRNRAVVRTKGCEVLGKISSIKIKKMPRNEISTVQIQRKKRIKRINKAEMERNLINCVKK